MFQLLGGKLPFSVPDNIDMAQAKTGGGGGGAGAEPAEGSVGCFYFFSLRWN